MITLLIIFSTYHLRYQKVNTLFYLSLNLRCNFEILDFFCFKKMH